MAGFYSNHFRKLLAYTTRGFAQTITEIASAGKRVLKVMEIGVGRF